MAADKKPKTGGRRKGTPNKLTASVKSAIEEAFANMGGVEYLERIAGSDPKAFCTLLGKILPAQINIANHDGTGAPTLRVEIHDPTKG